MAGATWWEMLNVFILSVLFPKVAYVVVQALNFNILQSLISVAGGSITGSFCFTFLFDKAIPLYQRWYQKYFPKRSAKKKVFSWKSRFIIKSKRNFGMIGIASIAPLISIPLASFIGVRFFSDRKKVFLWMALSCTAWAVVMHYFLDAIRDFWNHLIG